MIYLEPRWFSVYESVTEPGDFYIMHVAMTTKDIGLAVATIFIWAINVLFTKLAMESLSPLAYNFLRMIAVLPLVLFFPLKHTPIKSVVPSAMIIGVGHYGFLALGMHLGAGAAITGLLLQLNPFFSTLAAALILKAKPNKYHIWGFFPALAGIVYGCYYAPNDGVALGYIYVLVSAIFMGLGNVYLKTAMGAHTSSQEVTAFVVAYAPIAAPVLFAFMLLIEGPRQAFASLSCALDWKNMFYVCYAGWFSMVLAMKWWTKLLNKYAIAVVSPYTLLIPVFSLAMAAMIGEEIDQVILVSVVCIFTGLLISQIPSLQRLMQEQSKDR